MQSQQDKEYIASGRWKCSKSPTGAHWWIEDTSDHGEFECRFCHRRRKFGPLHSIPYKPNKQVED
jgi:hypothetical protein